MRKLQSSLLSETVVFYRPAMQIAMHRKKNEADLAVYVDEKRNTIGTHTNADCLLNTI